MIAELIRVEASQLSLIWKSLASAVFLLQTPTLAIAQEGQGQTPENAQRFLQLTLPDTFQLCNSSGCTNATRTSAVEISKNVCFTPFKVSYLNFTNVELGFLWDSIINVKQQGSQVDLVSINRVTERFDFGSDALATRAAFAMEFLRQHCDRAKDTGF